MSGAFVRFLLLLQEIPIAPARVDTATLARRLAQRGIRVSRRTIQRDLERLSARLPLQCDDTRRPFAWGWYERARDSAG